MNPQTANIKVIFLKEHTPATPDHQFIILRDYLKAKGITLREDMTIEV